MGGPQASANLSAALEAEARTLGAALILLAVPGDGRWWVLAASEPLLSAHPDPVELWGASAESADAGRAPAVVCEVLGQRPAQRWVSEAAPSPELRLAVYWTAAARIPLPDLVAARGRLVAAASTPFPPPGRAPSRTCSHRSWKTCRWASSSSTLRARASQRTGPPVGSSACARSTCLLEPSPGGWKRSASATPWKMHRLLDTGRLRSR